MCHYYISTLYGLFIRYMNLKVWPSGANDNYRHCAGPVSIKVPVDRILEGRNLYY